MTTAYGRRDYRDGMGMKLKPILLASCAMCLLILTTAPSVSEGQSATAPAASTRPAHNFARWEQEVAAYEAQDRTSPPPRGAVLFIGSSTIRLWETLAPDFPDTQVINRGFGGSQIVDSTHFADRLIFPHEPRAIFLRAGGNDINAGKSPQRVFDDYKDFVTKVHARLSNTRIIFISLCPAIARWDERDANRKLNELVAQYVREQNTPLLEYVETYDMTLDANGQARPELFVADKLHLNEAGYQILAERVRPFVSKK